MARKPMITRTILSTNVTVLAMDIVKCEALNVTINLPRTFSDDKKLLDACKAQVDTDTVKAVAIVDKTEVTKLYGMSEQDFMAHSVELDPVTRKPIASDATPEESADEE